MPDGGGRAVVDDHGDERLDEKGPGAQLGGVHPLPGYFEFPRLQGAFRSEFLGARHRMRANPVVRGEALGVGLRIQGHPVQGEEYPPPYKN